MSNLVPIDAGSACKMYLADIKGELATQSVEARKYQVGFFVRWCEGEENGEDGPRIENLNNVDGRDLHRFKNWRKEGLAKPTLRTNMSALKLFLEFCEGIDAVEQGTAEKVVIPSLTKGDNERETMIAYEKVQQLLEYYSTFHYASLRHIMVLLLWQSGCRMGALRSLDLGDIDHEKERVEFHHRPSKGTPLKNKEYGERVVTLPSATLGTIRDYVDHVRYDVEDDYGREPLFTTKNGRIHQRHFPNHVYVVTQPCNYNAECPSSKNPIECEAAFSTTNCRDCPHNNRPHDVRRGSITHWLKRDVPQKVISDRMDVSTKTLDRHYDARTEEEKAEQRRGYLEHVE